MASNTPDVLGSSLEETGHMIHDNIIKFLSLSFSVSLGWERHCVVNLYVWFCGQNVNKFCGLELSLLFTSQSEVNDVTVKPPAQVSGQVKLVQVAVVTFKVASVC